MPWAIDSRPPTADPEPEPDPDRRCQPLGVEVVEEMQRKLVQRQQKLRNGVRAGLTAAQRRNYARYTDLQVEYLLICKGQTKGVMADNNMTTALRQLKLEVDMDNYDEANVGTVDTLMRNRTAVKMLTSCVITHGMSEGPAVAIDQMGAKKAHQVNQGASAQSKIDLRVVRSLSYLLSRSKSLAHLELFGLSFTNGELDLFCNGLEANTVLKRLKLRKANFGEHGFHRVAAAISTTWVTLGAGLGVRVGVGLGVRVRVGFRLGLGWG